MTLSLTLMGRGLAGAQTVTGHANLATWMSNGPFGGVVQDIEIDPSDPNTVYAGTRGGVFKSEDGAETWVGKNEGLLNVQVQDVEVDPADPDSVFSSTNEGLFHSSDGGDSWSLSVVFHDPDRPWFRDSFYEVQFDPTGTYVFALAGYDLYRSADGGETWSNVFHQSPEMLLSVAVGADGRTVYLGTQGGLRVSADGGDEWESLPFPPEWAQSAAVDPRDASVVYVTSLGQLHKSTDRGVSWERLLPGVHVTEIEIASGSPDTVYARGSVSYAGDRDAMHVARSDDGGSTWEVETTMRDDVIDVTSLAIDPSSSSTAYVGTGGNGVLKTVDGAENFTQTVDGMTASNPKAVAVDPADPRRIYTSLWGGDSFRSDDAGETWRRIPSGPTPELAPYAAVTVTDLLVTSDSTVFGAGGSSDVYSTEPRIFKSNDHGESWVGAATGIPATYWISSLIEADQGTLIAGAYDPMDYAKGGVFKSSDGGANWVPISPVSEYARDVAYDPLHDKLYAVMGWGDSPYQSTLYSSGDGGTTWDEHVIPTNLADPGRVSVGPLGQVFLGSSKSTAIAVSLDLGTTWVPIQVADNKSSAITDVVQDPLDPTQIFVATEWGGIWVSKTAGATWEQLVPGVFGVDVQRLVFGPATPSDLPIDLPLLDHQPLYAAVTGNGEGGIWRVLPAPHPLEPPKVQGVPEVGGPLKCVKGLWSRSSSFRYKWLREGSVIKGATGRRYVARRADLRRSIACRVKGRGPGGTKSKSSQAVEIRR